MILLLYFAGILGCLLPFHDVAVHYFMDEPDPNDINDTLISWALAYGMALVWPVVLLWMGIGILKSK